MELYDKEYFTSLKERIKKIDKTPISFGLNYFVVSIIFFFIWANIFFSIVPFDLLYPMLPIPFVLLYSVVKRENSKSLLFVIIIMSITVFFELFDLAYYFNIHINDLPIFESDVCPICEVEESIQLIAISIIAILLMINRPMVTKFNLSKRNVLLAISLPSIILFLRIILFLIERSL